MHSLSLMQQGNYNFLECSEKSNFKEKISARVIPKKTKLIKITCDRKAL